MVNVKLSEEQAAGEDHFPAQSESDRSDYHRVAGMKTKPRPRLRNESAIDELVTAQADDERAWTAPIRVRRAKPTGSFSILGMA